MRPVFRRKRKLGASRFLQRRLLGRDETRAAVGREKAAIGEEASLRRIARDPFAQRPLHRLERVVFLVGERRQRADIEVARAVILEGGQRGMLAENVGGMR